MRSHVCAALLLLWPSSVFAQPSCPQLDGANETKDLAALPSPVAASLKEHVPNLSAPGSSFNGGDALWPGQAGLDRRLIAAFHHGTRWVVAYEAAGIGYHHMVVAYDLAGESANIVVRVQSMPGALCQTVAKAFQANGPVDRYW